jgi:hypothetical protein
MGMLKVVVVGRKLERIVWEHDGWVEEFVGGGDSGWHRCVVGAGVASVQGDS